jgi:preprotein translocase subunit SecA
MESSIAQLSDADIRNKTDEFKQLIADWETLYELLPAFAVVRKHQNER